MFLDTLVADGLAQLPLNVEKSYLLDVAPFLSLLSDTPPSFLRLFHAFYLFAGSL